MSRRSWIKMWVKMLRDNVFMSLKEEVRFVWVGLLLLAGDSAFPGKICLTENVGFIPLQIATLLNTNIELLLTALKALEEAKMIKYNPENHIIVVSNWDKYQSEYQRQKGYRKGYKRKLRNKVTKIHSPSISPSPSTSVKSLSSKSKDFIKPNVNEIKEYANSIGYLDLDAEYFLNYYEANGWVQGKCRKPIKSWKATVSNWKKNKHEFTSNENTSNKLKPEAGKYDGI